MIDKSDPLNSIDWGDTIVFSAYNPFHHLQRKLYHQSFGKHVVAEYWPVQEREANILLRGLLDRPESFDKQVERCCCLQSPHVDIILTLWQDFREELYPILDSVIVLKASMTNISICRNNGRELHMKAVAQAC